MSDWIDTTKELPPHDGIYEVTNNISDEKQFDFLNYDGYGFILLHAYRPIKFWRHCKSLVKRYGKIE
jgi:hypothetical protein